MDGHQQKIWQWVCAIQVGVWKPIVLDVESVHTNANGIERRDGCDNKMNRSGSEEDIQRFNALCGKAKEDREVHEDVDKKLLEKWDPWWKQTNLQSAQN